MSNAVAILIGLTLLVLAAGLGYDLYHIYWYAPYPSRFAMEVDAVGIVLAVAMALFFFRLARETE